MDVGHVSPALLLWMLISIPASWLSFFLFYPAPISIFHLAYAIANLGAVIVLLSGWFEDLTEASTDWNGGSVGSWALIGLASMFIASLLLSVLFGQVLPSIWVPQELYPLEITQVGMLLPFMMNVFGTWFSVTSGEEGLKISTSAIFKGYEHYGVELPFALHPARLLANGTWAVMHVIKGQFAFPFFISVFISGIIMDWSSAQSGSILTNYLIHAIFNTVILTATFLMGGTLTLIPS